MGVRGVRLYHDQALYKEPGGGLTPWHADQYYWPLASDRCCTVWLPLQETPLEMGPLAFSVGSHHVDVGRDLRDHRRERGGDRRRPLDRAELPMVRGALRPRRRRASTPAGPSTAPAPTAPSAPREVMTVIYMDADMRLAAPRNRNQQIDWETWCPGAIVGERIETPLNPVLYP